MLMPGICPLRSRRQRIQFESGWQMTAIDQMDRRCGKHLDFQVCYGSVAPLLFWPGLRFLWPSMYFIIRRELDKEVCAYPVQLPLNQIRCIWSIGQFRWKMRMNESVAPTGFSPLAAQKTTDNKVTEPRVKHILRSKP